MFSKAFIAWKKDYGEKIALAVCEILRQHGVEYAFDEPKDCDLAITIGGDGTLLRYQSSLECPILGINPGKSVGFYLSANSKDFRKKLEKLLEGVEGKDYFIREYLRLETDINKVPTPFYALNEVLVSPIFVRRSFDSSLSAKGKTTVEKNSGILIFTSSGSNAYAKSVGATPLRDPKKFGIAAIAPYSGRLKRALVLEKGQVSIKCMNAEGEVCIDGREEQVCRLKLNDVVLVKKSARPVRIVLFRK
jgi:NAD kinase